ncbi:MAG: hypothetical protein L0229_26115 [Blastocatellia bacterium]|nr:hypothetical protein [Blastocatellia bacterium]
MATIIDVFNIVGSRVVREPDQQESAPYQDTTSIAVDARVSVYPLGENHPLAHMFGKYDDEPLWEGFEEAIRMNPDVIDYDSE